MISVNVLFRSFCEYAMDHISGPDPLPEWLRKLNESQRELLDIVAPNYDSNERIRSIMQPLIKHHSVSGLLIGQVDYPSDFYRLAGAVNAVHEGFTFVLNHTHENGIALINRIPQRQPSLSKLVGYWHPSPGGIKIYPTNIAACNYYYIKKPVDAVLSYAYSDDSSTGEMVLRESAGTVNLEWNDNAFNLLLYKLLEKYGVIDKNALNIEYGKYGINTDIIKTGQ